jgi:hypothetical protein
VIGPLVEERTTPIIRDHLVPNALKTCVRWDLVNFLQAVELNDQLSNTFYLEIGEIYLQGHFPCGWRGNYPKGKMVIY